MAVSGGLIVGETYPSTINLGLANKQQCTGVDLFRTNTSMVSENSASGLIQSGLQESPRKAAGSEFQAESRLTMMTERHRTRAQSTAVARDKGVLGVV